MTTPYSCRPSLYSARDERRAELIDAAADLSIKVTVEDGVWAWRVLDRDTELEADGGCDSEDEARRKAEHARYHHAAAEVARQEVFRG